MTSNWGVTRKPKEKATPVAAPPLPSGNITLDNIISRISECHQYMFLSQWSHFRFLYAKLTEFTHQPQHTGPAHDELHQAMAALKLHAVDSILRNLEGSRKFDDFLDWMERLSEIIPDKRTFWNILHTEVQASLKVTLTQSDDISSHFFTAEQRFDFGLDSFLRCQLCDHNSVKTVDDVIDIF
jgi:hypothetical protein